MSAPVAEGVRMFEMRLDMKCEDTYRSVQERRPSFQVYHPAGYKHSGVHEAIKGDHDLLSIAWFVQMDLLHANWDDEVSSMPSCAVVSRTSRLVVTTTHCCYTGVSYLECLELFLIISDHCSSTHIKQHASSKVIQSRSHLRCGRMYNVSKH